MSTINPCSSIYRYFQSQSNASRLTLLVTALTPTIVVCALQIMKSFNKTDCQSFIQPACYIAARISNPLDFCMEEISYSNDLLQKPLTYITAATIATFLYVKKVNTDSQTTLDKSKYADRLNDVNKAKIFFTDYYKNSSENDGNLSMRYEKLNNYYKKLCCRNLNSFVVRQQDYREFSEDQKALGAYVNEIDNKAIRQTNEYYKSKKNSYKKNINNKIVILCAIGNIAIALAAMVTVIADTTKRQLNCAQICSSKNMVTNNTQNCGSWSYTCNDNCYSAENLPKTVTLLATFAFFALSWTLLMRESLNAHRELKLEQLITKKYCENLENLNFYKDILQNAPQTTNSSNDVKVNIVNQEHKPDGVDNQERKVSTEPAVELVSMQYSA